MPFGCGDDRMFGLWMTRADVTGLKVLAVDNSGAHTVVRINGNQSGRRTDEDVSADRKNCPGQ